MEIIIVAVRTLCQEEYWQKKLRQRASLLHSTQLFVITVRQSYDKGALDGLSAFLIYHRAQEKAKFLYQIDLFALQKQGIPVTIYCEGKMEDNLLLHEADLPYSFKLPMKIEDEALTLLEATIAQTKNRVSQQDGRFSIVRTDSIYARQPPSKEQYTHHIELVYKKLNRLADEWISLSFSLQMTFALLQEFQTEIEEQNYGVLRSLNPLTFKKNDHRTQRFLKKFLKLHTEKYFLNIQTAENSGYIWNFTSLKAYYQNTLKLTTTTPEGMMMRFFYNVNNQKFASREARVIKDENSHLINCNIRSGKIRNSVLIDVNATFLDVQNCVIVGVNTHSLQGKLFLLYHEKRNSKTFKFMMPGGCAHA